MSDTLVIRVNPELKQRLVMAARDDDRSVSSLVRRALNQAVATVPTGDTGAEGGEQ